MEEWELKIIKEVAQELLQNMTVAVLDVKINNKLMGDGVVKENIELDILIKDPQILIGQQGQTLFELSRLLRIIINKKIKKDFYLDIDINNYKKNKVEYLKDLANSLAGQVAQTREKTILPPMPAYERRVIHTELAGRQDVATKSHGYGIDRCVVIICK